jgi:predicted aldo/keto reductase-like oxidoreductase
MEGREVHPMVEGRKKKIQEDKRVMSRRDFLKSTGAGMAAVWLSAEDLNRSGQGEGNGRPEKRKFVWRTLGKTGIRLPVITMGVMNCDNPNLVRAALDAGMVHLDTAHGYQRGRNEEIIGEVLKGRPRDSYVIATKVSLPRDNLTGLYRKGGTAEDFLSRVDISLKRLGLEYVDILYHHNVWKRESALFEPIWKAMEKVKKEGKTRFVGISTHRNEPEVIQAAVDSKFYDIVLTSYNFRQNHKGQVKKAVAKAAAAGLGVVGMKAIGGRRRGSQGNERAEARAALKWVIQDPNVHTVIAGMTAFDQLDLNLEIMESPAPTGPDRAQLQRLAAEAGLFCQGCGVCMESCRQKLPLPELMRAYMYLYGYRNIAAAQELVLDLDLPSELCAECSSCSVRCLQGFPVSARVQDVARLREAPVGFIA